HSLNKRRGRFTAGEARPLHRSEKVRDYRTPIVGTVDDDRHEERLLLRHVMSAFGGKHPLMAKITFESLLGMLGDDGNEQDAVLDLLPDLLVPGIPAPQLALVEKDLDARDTQCLANPSCRLRILRSVADEYH